MLKGSHEQEGMRDMDSLSQDTIREIAYGFQKSRILLTAIELDVFTVLGSERKSSAYVAGVLRTDERATDRLLNALCAIDLLEKTDDKFSNTAPGLRFLVRGKPESLSGLMHTVHLWEPWGMLTQAIRRGRPGSLRRMRDRGNEWLIAFIAAMHDRASKQAAGVVAQLDLRGVSRVLDLGGGSGAYAMAFARAKTDLQATVFDLPQVISLAKKYIEKEGLSKMVRTLGGDYLVDDLGTGYDLVFLSAIIHSNSLRENETLLGKCVAAVNPRGRVVVQDYIMDEDRISPAAGAIFALNMLVSTDGGDSYTENEVRMLMKKAGLSRVERRDTPFGVSHMIGFRITDTQR